MSAPLSSRPVSALPSMLPFVLACLLVPLAAGAQSPPPPPPAARATAMTPATPATEPPLSVPPAPPPSAPADNCGPIREQIEARFRAGGVQPVLAVVEVGLNAGGRVVGTCGNGRRQIVQLGSGPLAAGASGAVTVPDRGADRPPERPPDRVADRPAERPAERPPEREPVDRIPTECKDGSIVIGPNCDDPRAVRMTSAELAASLAPARAGSAPAAAASDAPPRPAPR